MFIILSPLHNLVKKKIGLLRPLLFELELRYNYQINNYSDFAMNITSDLNNHLLKLCLNKALKYTYISLLLEHSELNWFYFDKAKWLHRYHLERKQFERDLEQLENKKLLKRKKDTHYTGDRKIGNALFLKLTPPISTTNSENNMTFCGTPVNEYCCKTKSGKAAKKIKLIRVSNVDRTMRLPAYWISRDFVYMPIDAKEGKVYFKASPYISNTGQLLLNLNQGQAHG